MLIFLLAASPAHAQQLYVIIRDPHKAVRLGLAKQLDGDEEASVGASMAAGVVATVLSGVGANARMAVVGAVPEVKQGFEDKGVTVTVKAVKLTPNDSLQCYTQVFVAPFDDSLQAALISGYTNVTFTLPNRPLFALDVETSGFRGGFGDLFGGTESGLFESFRASGLEIAICSQG